MRLLLAEYVLFFANKCERMHFLVDFLQTYCYLIEYTRVHYSLPDAFYRNLQMANQRTALRRYTLEIQKGEKDDNQEVNLCHRDNSLNAKWLRCHALICSGGNRRDCSDGS